MKKYLGKRHDPHPGVAYHDRGNQRRATPTERRTTPGGAPLNTHRRRKHQTPYRSHQRTATNHRKPHEGWREEPTRGERATPTEEATGHTAHQHVLTARRRPRLPQGPPHRHRKRTKARPQRPGLGMRTRRGHLPAHLPHIVRVWFVVDTTVDTHLLLRIARQPLHKATAMSLGTQALLLWKSPSQHSPLRPTPHRETRVPQTPIRKW